MERDQILIDHDIRHDDGWHGEPPHDTLTATLHIAAIDLTLTAADIYRDVIAA